MSVLMCLHPSAPKATREEETGSPQKLMGDLASGSEQQEALSKKVQGHLRLTPEHIP